MTRDQPRMLEGSYDRDADVLYLTSDPGTPAISKEGLPGVLWRYRVGTADLIGMTVLDFGAYWQRRRRLLDEAVAEKFGISHEEAKSTLDRFANIGI